MNKLRHLDNTLAVFTSKGAGRATHTRPDYEQALINTGWEQTVRMLSASYFAKAHRRICVENGDRVMISFDNVSWKMLNRRAKNIILLEAQGLELRR